MFRKQGRYQLAHEQLIADMSEGWEGIPYGYNPCFHVWPPNNWLIESEEPTHIVDYKTKTVTNMTNREKEPIKFIKDDGTIYSEERLFMVKGDRKKSLEALFLK